MRALRRAAMLAQLVARPAIWRKGCARFRAGLVVLRPPPAARSPTPLTLNTRGPGFVLGRVTSAPLQSARLFTRQLLRLDLADLERHAMLVGTTGAGKTTSLSRLMDASMSTGWAVLVVDAKGGRLASVCRALGASHGLPARVWLPGPPDSWKYDPCAGDPAAVGNRLIGAFDHGRDGQVYRNLSQALVPLAAQALLESGQACTLDTLRYSLDEAHLTGLARRTPDVGLKTELLAMLCDPLHRKALSGVAGRLRTRRFGGFGAWPLPSDPTLYLAACLPEPAGATPALP